MTNRNGNLLLTALVVLLVAAAGSLAGFYAAKYFGKWFSAFKETNTSLTDVLKKDTNPFGEADYVRILVLGTDKSRLDNPKSDKQEEKNGLADTIVVLCINTKSKEIRAISFPRDTRVTIPGHGTQKLNAAHVIGGPQLVKEVLEQNFLDGITIDYYIKTDTTSFRKMVDLVGGVYILVEERMKYTDRSQGLYIDLHPSPEKQLLNGKDAEGYVRFRKDRYGDTSFKVENGEVVNAGRIVRQQKFIVALCNRIISMDSRTKRADFIKTCYQKGYIESDLKLTDWDALADYVLGFNPDQMLIDVLPGTPTEKGVSYWIPDREKITEIVNRDMLFVGENPKIAEAAAKKAEAQAAAAAAKEAAQAPAADKKDYRITVLNGTSVTGLAKNAAAKLAAKGYTNVTAANASKNTYEETELKVKTRDANLTAVRGVIGCGKETEPSSGQESDLVIILGGDYAKRGK
ncbi:MAG: LCP family protein [Abditibacteriota bacterium]|nr:LCP family protein [Abditibacteriota bacterium]